jgi:hypothetical protein
MRALVRCTPNYRTAFPHLEKYNWCTRQIAKLSRAAPCRAVATLGNTTALNTSNSLLTVTTSDLHENSGSKPTNRIHIDPDGEEVTESTTLEALGIPATEGEGFAQVSFGDANGVKDHYKIVPEFGWGTNSSVSMNCELLHLT